MNRARQLVLYAACFYLAAGSALAGVSNVQFSAQAVQSTPDRPTRQAQIYVGDNSVRLEYRQDQQDIVEIYDMKNQRALLLLPQSESYIENEVPEGGMMNPMLAPREASPCAQVPDAKCQQLATETLYGRQVVKWEMQITRDGRPLSSLLWIDPDRQMPLRRIWPDGSVSEMRPLGQQSLNGRLSEHWEVRTTHPDGQSTQSAQWYDPELRIVTREQLPGGYLRELRNIRLAPQPAHLFSVPAGYRRVIPQPQKQPSAAGGSSQQQAPYPVRQYPGR